MTTVLKDMRLTSNAYNLVTAHQESYPSGQFGSCANIGRWDKFPYGCDVIATTEALGDSQEDMHGGDYRVHQKQIDIRGGNYLIARWVEKLNRAACHDKVGESLPIPAYPNLDGPPCRCGYFEEWYIICKYGWMSTDCWARIKDEERTKQAFAEIATVRGTIAFLLGQDQLEGFKKYLLVPLQWEDKVVYTSPLIHNRAHADTGNTLTLIVLQIQE